MPIRRLAEPYAQSHDDYTTFAALADALGFGEQFTEGRSTREWLAHMYDKWSAGLDFAVPTFDAFWAMGRLRLPLENRLPLPAAFRPNPKTPRLNTPTRPLQL